MRSLAIFLISGSLFGQRILYNEGLDKKGQEAAEAAKKIASEPVTSKQLQNLSIVEKQEVEGVLKDGFVTMRTQIQAFDTWGQGSRAVCKTLRQLYADDELAALLLSAQVANHPLFDQTCTVPALNAEKIIHEQKVADIKAKSTPLTNDRFAGLAANLKEQVDKLKQ